MVILKSKSGIININLLLLLFCIIGLGYFQLFLTKQLEHQAKLRTSCLKIFLPVHQSLNRSVDNLLSLNPQSTALKIEYNLLTIQISAALAAGRFESAMALQIKQDKVMLQRFDLDVKQKTIILNANRLITQKIRDYTSLVRSESNAYQEGVRHYMNFSSQITEVYPTRFAVEPQSTDIAPNYKMSGNFSTQQGFKILWSSLWIAVNQTRLFQNFNFKHIQTCEVTSERSLSEWRLKIKMDKWQ